MSRTILLIITVFSTLYAGATPNYVDCTDTSTPVVDKRVAASGFGILYTFPSTPVTVYDFVYGKAEEAAWAKVIVSGTVYETKADCKTKINRGVFCEFDLENVTVRHNSDPQNAQPLSDSVTRFNAAVIDKDVQKDEVEISIGIDTEPNPHQYSAPKFKNLNTLDNYYKKSCASLDVLPQG